MSEDKKETMNEGTDGKERKKNVYNGGTLISLADRDKEELKAIGSKGGKKSGEVKRARKTFRESLLWLLDQQATEEQKKAAAQYIADASGLSQRDMVNFAMVNEAAQGNVKAAQFVRDTVGEMPTVKQEVSTTITDGDRALLEKVNARLEKGAKSTTKTDKNETETTQS